MPFAVTIPTTNTLTLTVTAGGPHLHRTIKSPKTFQVTPGTPMTYQLELLYGPPFAATDTMVVTTYPQHGTITYDAATHTITYTPNGTFVGVDSAKYFITQVHN